MHWYLVGVVVTAFFFGGAVWIKDGGVAPGAISIAIVLSLGWPYFWGLMAWRLMMGWAERD